jgi:predicted amidohydrolase
MMGLPGPLLILERYLWRLAFAMHPAVSPVPALHTESRARAEENQEEFRVATLSILADVHDVFWEEDDHRFWGDRLKRPTEVYERLDWALQKCREERADVIVLPELNADEEIRRQLAAMFAPGEGGHTPQLIVCGALHHAENEKRGTYKNQPWVMTRAGQLDWDYWKKERNIENLPHGKRTEALGSVPPHVLAIDLPIGRVAVAICKDMLDPSFRQAIEQLRTNVMLLISMTGNEAARSFREHAREMAASSRMVTVYCNSSIHHREPLYKKGARPLSFLHPNTQISFEDIPSYELPGENVQAVVGMYTLTPGEDGLRVDLEPHFRGEHAPPEEQELGSAAAE